MPSALTAQIPGMFPSNFRNLLINGDFQIDQRNAGAAKTVNSTTVGFGPDRWYGLGQNTDGVFTIQQVTNSVPVSGAKYATKITVTTADASIGTTQYYVFDQRIEGQMCSQLMWGTAGAKTVTLSFWARSSVTGTFGGSLQNSTSLRCYPFSYTIIAADTWEKKTITVPGCTDGTWLTTNGIGVVLRFSIGMGATYKGTANAWSSGTEYDCPTGSVDLISTLNATMYLADVQLEAGSGASDFERLPFDEVLRRCQRYYCKVFVSNFTYAPAGTYGSYQSIFFPVTMRAIPPTPTVLVAGNVVNQYSGYPVCAADDQSCAEIQCAAAAAGGHGTWARQYGFDAEL